MWYRIMIPTLAAVLIAGPGLAGTGGGAATKGGAEGIDLPGQARKGLEGMAAGLGPVITVSWEERRSSPLSVAEYAKVAEVKRPEANDLVTGRETVRLTWRADGRYAETMSTTVRGKGGKQVPRSNAGYSYDGRTFYTHTMNPGEPHGLSRVDADEEEGIPDISTSYFVAAGVSLQVQPLEVAAAGGARALSVVTRLLEEPEGRVTKVETVAAAEGRQLTRVRVETGGLGPIDAVAAGGWVGAGAMVFDLDPDLGYAVRRAEQVTEEGRVAARTECKDFRPVEGRGIWLPWSCRKVWYGDDGKELRESEWVVTGVDVAAMGDEKFVIEDRTPGTWVIDHYKGAQTVRVVQKDGTMRVKRNVPKAGAATRRGQGGDDSR